jgi:hypothetical protein
MLSYFVILHLVRTKHLPRVPHQNRRAVVAGARYVSIEGRDVKTTGFFFVVFYIFQQQ